MDDIQTLRPTILVGVPRLLLRIEMAIRSATLQAPGIRGALSRRALRDKYVCSLSLSSLHSFFKYY